MSTTPSKLSPPVTPSKRGYITLREACNITGLKIQTLRMRLKKGKIEGLKTPSKFGTTWLVKLDDLNNTDNIEPHTLNNEIPQILKGSNLTHSSITATHNKYLIQAKEEHLKDLQRHIDTQDKLLTIFQERIMNIEAEKASLENKLKMLPSPPEEILLKLTEKEDFITTLQENLTIEKNALQNKEEEKQKLDTKINKLTKEYEQKNKQLLQGREETEGKLKEEIEALKNKQTEMEEKYRPWWKKLFSIK